MGARLQTRIAIAVFMLMLVSTAATTYVIAANAQANIEEALRERLTLQVTYLRDTVEENARLGAALHGFVNLQAVLDATVERDPDLRMVAVLAEDGSILYSADRGEALQWLPTLPATRPPLSGRPEIIATPLDIIARVRITTAHGDPAGQIVVALPFERMAPEVERLIALLLGGALAIIFGLTPFALIGVFLILRPLGRGLAIVTWALEAISRGEAAKVPSRTEALAGGDPEWDAPEPAELDNAYIRLVDSFAQARTSLDRALSLMSDLERRIARLDSEGSQALGAGAKRAILPHPVLPHPVPLPPAPPSGGTER